MTLHCLRLYSRDAPRAETRCRCGAPITTRLRTPPTDGVFPLDLGEGRCSRCGRLHRLKLIGYRLNPTGEVPILDSTMPINMARLLRELALPSYVHDRGR